MIFSMATLIIDVIVSSLASFRKRVSYYGVIFAICMTTVFIPSEKTMYLMIASAKIKKSELTEKVIKVLDAKLDEYVNNKGE